MTEKPTQVYKPAALITDPVARASSPGLGSAPKDGFAPLVPELAVSNLEESLSFWCGHLALWSRMIDRRLALPISSEGRCK